MSRKAMLSTQDLDKLRQEYKQLQQDVREERRLLEELKRERGEVEGELKLLLLNRDKQEKRLL